jgi:pimeloyl-ACP methyl ester carboxylesterase
MQTPTHRLPGLVLTDHVFRVPLDHGHPEGETLEIFAREAVAPGREDAALPWLLFLQGGPGFPAPRPGTRSGWLKRALGEYRVLLLDQRGTGRSAPVTFQTLAARRDARAVADYLTHFRADAIVRDAELIRRELVGADAPWSVLGQSFGGFCAAHYLSVAPAGLREVCFTGGLPPLEGSPDEVYRATYRRVLEKNRLYYERYPDDAARAAAVADHLARHEVRLPTGDRLSPRRFQQLGMKFGMSDGFEAVHYLLEEAFVTGAGGPEIGYGFLRGLENIQSFDTNPIYAVLHEAIYCQEQASRWAADRVLGEFPEFALAPGGPVRFTGEMVYPWMFDEFRHLRPLKEAAEILAAEEHWPRLYDPAVLGANTVPCAAAVYLNDMYVEREFSEATAGAIRGLRLWVTSEHEHNALRAEGETVLGRLLAMLHGEA